MRSHPVSSRAQDGKRHAADGRLYHTPFEEDRRGYVCRVETRRQLEQHSPVCVQLGLSELWRGLTPKTNEETQLRCGGIQHGAHAATKEQDCTRGSGGHAAGGGTKGSAGKVGGDTDRLACTREAITLATESPPHGAQLF